jgi:hypothetical protein
MGTRQSRGMEIRYARSWLAGMCAIMIVSDRAPLSQPGRTSMPTSSRLSGPRMSSPDRAGAAASAGRRRPASVDRSGRLLPGSHRRLC